MMFPRWTAPACVVIALALAGVSESAARPEPQQRAQAGQRLPHGARAHFAGARPMVRAKELPAVPMTQVGPSAAAALQIGKLVAGAKGSPAPGTSVSKPGLAKPVGPTPHAGPTAPSGPLEFAFVPPSEFGKASSPVRLVAGRASGWWPDSTYGRANEALSFDIARPPAGKVATVRCAIELELAEARPNPGIRVTVGNATSVTPLGGSTGLVQFSVFPGKGPQRVTLVPDPDLGDKVFGASSFWRVFGCDRRVD